MRLHVIKLPKNNGVPGLPRNVGIQSARGKYIAFLDSDDLFTPTALEELSTLAEEYQADVVQMNDSFRLFNGQALSVDDPRMTDFAELTNPANFSFTEWRWPVLPRPKPVEVPTLKPDTLEERVKAWVSWKYRLGVCADFCRRDFLIANQIQFPDILAAEDQVFNFACLCLAKNFLRVPNVVYIVRKRSGSISQDKQSAQSFEKYFNKWFSVLNDGFKSFDNFMEGLPFFKQNTEYKNAVLDFFFMCIVDRHVRELYLNNPPHALYPVVKKEFHDNALAAYLFNTVNVYRLQIMKLQQENNALKNLPR